MSSAAERAIHCHRCGTTWRLPEEVGASAHLVCSRCEEILARRGPLEGAPPAPFVRRYGMAAGSLWGWLIGSTWWLPAVLAAWVLRSQFDAWAFLLLSVPCVGTVYWLLLRRRRTPSVVWRGYVGLGAGGYACYLWVLFAVWLAPRQGNLLAL